MDVFYRTLVQTTYGDQESKEDRQEWWEIQRFMLGVVIKGLWKARMGDERDYGAKDLHMCVVQYIWYKLQAHQIMGEFKATSFHKHSST